MNCSKQGFLPVAFLSCLLLSCSPVIHYFGDDYPASSSVEVYYKAAEVKKPYKTIGHMTKEVIRSESDKKYMIEMAKKKGADGIIFSDLSLDNDKKSTLVSVKAELIRYL
jgi:hypothetical protein